MRDTTDLITRYRPTTFDEVLGQEAVVDSLQHCITNQTARTFLLCGPSGVGKTTLARLVAKECGCVESNISEIDAATHTGIDAMRSLVDLVQYHPLTGTLQRAVIVDEAHALSAAAWKSLLKAIEEPPEGLYWFFCTTELDKVPNTIRTRCASYTLKPVRVDDLVDLLEAVSAQEQYRLPEAVVELLASEASGSPRQALANLAICSGCTSAEEAEELLQSVREGGKEVIELCRQLVRGELTWKKVQGYLIAWEGKDSESIRVVIVAYLLSMLKTSKSDRSTLHLLSLLSHFAEPWTHDRTQPTSLCLALGSCLFTAQE